MGRSNRYGAGMAYDFEETHRYYKTQRDFLEDRLPTSAVMFEGLLVALSEDGVDVERAVYAITNAIVTLESEVLGLKSASPDQG